MKPYNYIGLVLLLISNCIFAQSNPSEQQDSQVTTTKFFNVQSFPVINNVIFNSPCDSVHLNYFKVKKNNPFTDILNTSQKTSTLNTLQAQNLTTSDSIAIKRLYDSICFTNYKLFSKESSFTTINHKVYENLKFKPLPKQQIYFSIHDYTTGSHLARVSQYENPFFDNAKNLRFLWSGHVIPYKEIGASENYLRSNQQPPLMIKFIRNPQGKLHGIWVDRLQPEFHYLP